jgi:glucitol/sorbitol PTS system EIIA component
MRMMAYQFKAQIISIGKWATESLKDDMIILFKEQAPSEVADYCFLHNQGTDQGIVTTESTLLLGDTAYVVTAVGKTANINLQQLGHITIKFDGAQTPELPRCIHVLGPKIPELRIGVQIIFG